MADWEKLNKEFDAALDSMSEQDWKTFKRRIDAEMSDRGKGQVMNWRSTEVRKWGDGKTTDDVALRDAIKRSIHENLQKAGAY